MSVQADDALKEYDGNGAAVLFDGPRLFDADTLTVTLVDDTTGAVTTPSYTLTNVGVNGPSLVQMDVAPPLNTTLQLRRTLPYAQTADFTDQQTLLRRVVEAAFDTVVMLIQQLADGVKRSIRFSDTVVGFDGEIQNYTPLGVLQITADGKGIDAGSPNGAGDMLLRPDLAAPGGAGLVSIERPDGTAQTLQDAVREKVTANRTYYVRTDGNNSSNGLANTAGGAFLTIQKAVDTVLKLTDTNGLNVTISVANGTYAGSVVVNGPIPGGGTLYIVGNPTTPASCVVNATGADAFLANGGAQVLVTGFKVTTTTSGNGINAINSSVITVGAMEFGACVNSHVNAAAFGVVAMTANYAITGGGESHLHVGSPGLITFGTVTATLTGTPAFSAYFAGVAQGSIIATTATFTGAATGSRYLSHNAGVIMAHPGFANPFPGSVAGWADAGGFYKAGVVQGVQVAAERGSGEFITFQSWNGGAQTYRSHIVLQTDAGGVGKGYCYFNGDDSYSSGRTHLGTDTRVQANVGTQDGVTVNSTGTRIEASASGAACGWFRRQTSDGSIFDFLRSNTFVGSITVTAAATQYNVASDERVKFDIQPAAYDPTWINRVAATLRTFRYNADPDNQVTGPIAQLLADVQPNAVSVGDANADAKPGDEGFEQWGVDNSKLVAELLLEVAELRRRLDALEG